MPASSLCADCSHNAGEHEIRKRRLCSDCFIRYVNSKILKRMESYRFKNLSGDQKKRLLLPLSGGVSSSVLLHALNKQLQKQVEKQNRTAYDLVLVHIEPVELEHSVSVAWREGILARFPLHNFPSPVKLYQVFEIDHHIEHDLSRLGIQRRKGEDNCAFYASIFNSVSSVTTRADIHQVLMKRLLAALAKRHDCDSIVWGHSDSKLAAQALADVAKGRGGSVPAGISDGPSPARVTFNYPMRDLFKTELESYAKILEEPLQTIADFESGPMPSIRNTSIDDLLSTYILSQGEKYPSIMANVVRTASKLQVPTVGSAGKMCCVCWSFTSDDEHEKNLSEELCYGCRRMRQDIRT